MAFKNHYLGPNGIGNMELDDNSKFVTEDPTDESHAISCEDNMGALVNITLSMKGVTSYFPKGSQPRMNLRTAQGLN